MSLRIVWQILLVMVCLHQRYSLFDMVDGSDSPDLYERLKVPPRFGKRNDQDGGGQSKEFYQHFVEPPSSGSASGPHSSSSPSSARQPSPPSPPSSSMTAADLAEPLLCRMYRRGQFQNIQCVLPPNAIIG